MKKTGFFKITLMSLALLVFGIQSAVAALLPHPENVSIGGDILSWEPVATATGYNILLNYRYFDTVRDTTQYKLTQPGIYWIVAFDDAGNFGPDFAGDNYVEYLQSDESTDIVRGYYASIVQTTCRDVGPGESCVATCGSLITQQSSPQYARYASGGACSTSDIVEADAFIGSATYSCTVPTFSGEVVAQVVCAIRIP